mmetsp:Transcript_16575/g.18433  ORF Transcript_16575/g.18433 Transcript_16575/m.18433 type:complete len:152 (-) Transcript_16575:48-503(-)
MSIMETIGYSCAGAIYVALGALHTGLTIYDEFSSEPHFFAPYKDKRLLEQMKNARFPVPPENVPLWRAYIGFNYTHSLSLLFEGIGILYLMSTSNASDRCSGTGLIMTCSSALFVFIARRYFFSKPFQATSLATILCMCNLAYDFHKIGAL